MGGQGVWVMGGQGVWVMGGQGVWVMGGQGVWVMGGQGVWVGLTVVLCVCRRGGRQRPASSAALASRPAGRRCPLHPPTRPAPAAAADTAPRHPGGGGSGKWGEGAGPGSGQADAAVHAGGDAAVSTEGGLHER